MAKIVFKNKFLIIIILCMTLFVSVQDAFAWGRGHGDRYYWHEGRWHRQRWFGPDVIITSLTIGALVEGLPFGYRTTIVSGVPYYYYDKVYYRPCPGGYVVVPAPVVSPVVVAPSVTYTPAATTQTQSATSGQTVTINIPSSKGGYMSVTLVKQGNGYIGPQGEYYEGNPTVDQLRVLYGK